MRGSFQLDGPQPCCEGPKLRPFQNRGSPITYNRLLSDPEYDGHSFVFEVKIASRLYALKVFKFYSDEEAEEGLEDSECGDFDLDTLHAHGDPFYAECRAYGKLIDAGLNGRVAVRCHGYLTIPAEKERLFQKRFQIEHYDWNRQEDDCDRDISEQLPLRAIVKDLVRDDPPLTHKLIKRMKRDLLRMRQEEVYPMDIKERNYKGGLLVDLSAAITEPHYWFRINEKRDQLHMYKVGDLISFDEMVRESNVKTLVRTLPNRITLRKLRPRKEKQG